MTKPHAAPPASAAPGATKLAPPAAPSPAQSRFFPPVPAPFEMPFYYSAASFMWTFYRADLGLLAQYLEGTGMRPARFDGAGLVSLCFQCYASTSATMSYAGTREVEFSIHGFPETREADCPELSLRDFLLGADSTKVLGRYLLHVPCDNPFAVRAGIEMFGEPKFNTTFDSNIPSPNTPGSDAWGYTVYDPQDPGLQICSLSAKVTSVVPVPANPSPLVEYGTLDGRLICALLNLFGPYQTFFLDPAAAAGVQLQVGASPHPMRADLQRLIGSSAPVAVQVYQSPIAAAETRACYV